MNIKTIMQQLTLTCSYVVYWIVGCAPFADYNRNDFMLQDTCICNVVKVVEVEANGT